MFSIFICVCLSVCLICMPQNGSFSMTNNNEFRGMPENTNEKNRILLFFFNFGSQNVQMKAHTQSIQSIHNRSLTQICHVKYPDRCIRSFFLIAISLTSKYTPCKIRFSSNQASRLMLFQISFRFGTSDSVSFHIGRSIRQRQLIKINCQQ